MQNDTNGRPATQPSILHIVDHRGFAAATRFALSRAGIDGNYQTIEGFDAGRERLRAIAERESDMPDLLVIDLHLGSWLRSSPLEVMYQDVLPPTLPVVVIANSPIFDGAMLPEGVSNAMFIIRPGSLEEYVASLRPLRDLLISSRSMLIGNGQHRGPIS